MPNDKLPSYIAPEPAEAGMVPTTVVRRAMMKLVNNPKLKKFALEWLSKINREAPEAVKFGEKEAAIIEKAAGEPIVEVPSAAHREYIKRLKTEK
jgi:hypothetical protein